jgi:aspartate aminotransferase-like enzyme
MRKHRLMTPGPSPVPEETLLELAAPVFHHRTPEFRAILTQVLADLKYVFATQHDVLILTASGTGAMEAALVNTVARGEKAIVLAAGRFGMRWAEICRAFGIEPVVVSVAPGQSVTPDQLDAALRSHADAVAVLATLCETSTGAGHDIAAMGKLVARSDAILAVDAISGAGAMECHTDSWGIDILVTGSQKALMLPPGLAFLTMSPKAWSRAERVKPQAFYFDLKKMRKRLADPDTPFTPAHTLIKALGRSLKMIREEGIENVWSRHRRLAAACRAGIQALGLDLFAAQPADAVTAVKAPPGIDTSKLLARLNDRFGLKLTGGQDELKGKIFRVAHMGYMDELDIIGVISALEQVLADLGWKVESGTAVRATQRVFVTSVT